MGQQVRFYAVHSEFRALLSYAQARGLLALPRMVETAAYDRRGYVEACPPLAFHYGTGGSPFYLVPQEVPRVEVFYHELRADPDRSYLAFKHSPVIEIAPGRREGDRLYHGRIYIDAPRHGPGAESVYRAYRGLARHVRNWPKVTKGVYAAPTTFERVSHGLLRFMVIGDRQLEVECHTALPEACRIPLEWIEIPEGEFVSGLTDEQRFDIYQQLYETYGIGDLPPELQAWIRATLNKPVSRYSPEENETLREEVLKLSKRCPSPALSYRHAFWALRRIPAAKRYWLPTFYIARFPITRRQAAAFYASFEAAATMGWRVGQHGRSWEVEDRPQMFQRWEEAQALAHWLGGRLPTPLEWEKAARGTEGCLYPWGDTWNPGAGHFPTSEAHRGDSARRVGLLTAVDACPEGASPYGVMDMVGNLAEWHTLTEVNDVGMMGYSTKAMAATVPWFYALAMHRLAATRRQLSRGVGCRPVLEVWGRHLWPGYRSDLE